MAKILSFRGKEHNQTQLVLPWYATGQLDAAERSAVEDHLARCPACRDDLEAERAMAAEFAGLALDANAGWSNLHRRLQSPGPALRLRIVEAIRLCLAWPGKFGWFLAVQALVAGLVLFVAVPRPATPEYHTLGTTPDWTPGNIIVMFRPDTSEAHFRAALAVNRARIVDGPLASGTYLIYVAPADRNTVLHELRSRRSIVLAQPIDGDLGK